MAAITQESISALITTYGAEVRLQSTRACLQQVVDEIGAISSLDIGPDAADGTDYVKYDRSATYNRYEKSDYLKYDRSVYSQSPNLLAPTTTAEYSHYDKSDARCAQQGLAVVQKYRAKSTQPC